MTRQARETIRAVDAIPQTCALAFAIVLAGCGDAKLSSDTAILVIAPLPEGTQTALTSPTGIGCGDVPLDGSARARFRISNLGLAPLEVRELTIASEADATLTVLSAPSEVGPNSSDEIVLVFAPHVDGGLGSARVSLTTNTEEPSERTIELIVTGTGIFVGEPNLELCHSSNCYDPQPGDCTAGAGNDTCILPTLDFGPVAVGESASAPITLRNSPAATTCNPPPGSPGCTATCRLEIVSIEVEGTEFGLAGNLPTPFSIDSLSQELAEPGCGFDGEIRFLLSYTASPSPTASNALIRVTLGNDPDAPIVEIPLTGQSAYPPVAVAEFLACDPASPGSPCSVAGTLRPLDTVYLDGRSSYDRDAAGQPDLTAPLTYAWTMIDAPPGATDFAPTATTSPLPSFWLPLAGRYTVRLSVTNSLGIPSLASATSDVTFEAVPAGRVHLQLVWDNDQPDLDLHLTSVDHGDLVCDKLLDCHWSNCHPDCLNLVTSDCAATPPVWFASDPATLGPNPRLDIDDRLGAGPENVNIDQPAVGVYPIYVHYYGLIDGPNPQTLATVRVFIDGTMRAELRQQLRGDNLWLVGQLEWLPNTGGIVTTAPPGTIRQLTGCTVGRDFSSLPLP